ncbi:MAG: aminoacyl-tRNA hydrolase [Gemmatimonadetes bacterium]|nr:aminoacyl-tRNA hydrolase [Gemmatimonadota bacterium]
MGVRIVVGLGNPGVEYEETRHNVGFRVVDRLAARHRLAAWTRRGERLEVEGRVAGRPTLLVKPLTFMNRSGLALAALAREEPFDPEELVAVYDDLDLPLGRIRVRPGGSAGTHNGMRSVIERLGTTAFPRVRVGIAPLSGGWRDATEFVLRPFRDKEREEIDLAEERAADALECILREDVITAMNRYNPEPE